jgi:two-component system copper resistance phosphate regulon response regulator CusR
MRILVIEDEVKTAEYVRQGLTECGYVVDCVHTGSDGLFLAKQHMYELIILDINLPEMDGWQVLELLRRKDCSSRIMMLTARSRLPN